MESRICYERLVFDMHENWSLQKNPEFMMAENAEYMEEQSQEIFLGKEEEECISSSKYSFLLNKLPLSNTRSGRKIFVILVIPAQRLLI